MEVEHYYNENNEAGILVAPGYGAGWSTWNELELAFDKRVVKYFIEKNSSKDDMEAFLESIGYKNTYMGAYDFLKVEWIPKGTGFYIEEYDGSETIKTDVDFIQA